VTTGDLGLVLAFALSGTSATVVVNYDTQPEPPAIPEPGSLALVGLGLAGLGVAGVAARTEPSPPDVTTGPRLCAGVPVSA